MQQLQAKPNNNDPLAIPDDFGKLILLHTFLYHTVLHLKIIYRSICFAHQQSWTK
jgi:hypothetical protein